MIEENIFAARTDGTLPPSELDVLVYIASECEVNEWERGFLKSTITYFSANKSARMSEKQHAALMRMVVKFGIEKNEVVNGYADEQTVKTALKEVAYKYVPPPAVTAKPAARPASGFDDFDDDIPF